MYCIVYMIHTIVTIVYLELLGFHLFISSYLMICLLFWAQRWLPKNRVPTMRGR